MRGRACGFALAMGLAVGICQGQRATGHWVGSWIGSWAASQQVPEKQNVLPADALHELTLRQVFHLSAGGKTIRVHVSNAFGNAAMHVTAAHVAKPVDGATGRIDQATDRGLRFAGREDVVIPPGAEYVSDALEFAAEALSDVAVTIHVEQVPGEQTGHPGSRATSFFEGGDVGGKEVTAAEMPGARKVEHWYMVSGIDVKAAAGGYAVVALGDSITDGQAATVNGNARWPDELARRLARAGKSVGVLNEGIGGNHLLTDGLGPNALARFDRDVLAQTGVKDVIVLEGINDLGALARVPNNTQEQHEELVGRIVGAYEQIILRGHAAGLRVIGATILPDGGSGYYHPNAMDEEARRKVNAWIRAKGHFDAVVDLDKAMADPANAERLRPAYDSGDHLHPGPAGYKAMGQAIPLGLLR